MNHEENSLPPLSDPALWWDFRNRTFEWKNAQISLEGWQHYEQRGDKLASLLFFRLTDTYKLPFGWAHSLHEFFTSNDYWRRISLALDLPDRSQFDCSIIPDALEVL